MNAQQVSDQLSRIFAWGLPVISIVVVTGSVTDPVNAPKFLILGAVGISSLIPVIWHIRRKVFQDTRFTKLVVLLFLVWALVVSILSDSPISQNLYGVYGRNTGFFTYYFLAIMFFTSLFLVEVKHINRILIGFGVAVVVNIIYSLWVSMFGDFVGWDNPYKALLGTFGNPNFISAFFGMSVGPIFAFFVSASLKSKLYLLPILASIIYCLFQTDSIQGFVVSVVSLWLVGVFWVNSKYKNSVLTGIAFGSGVTTGVIGVIGAFGNGPLARLVEQPTIVLRQQYWYAAYKMGESNPIFGIGMDSYGDWYRRARGSEALVSPGAETVTNVAHNVFFDIFAYGGFPLLILYVSIVAASLVSIVKILKRNKNFEPLQVSFAAIFIAYQMQSLVSINQIGLAVWGWISGGILVSISNLSNKPAKEIITKKVIQKSEIEIKLKLASWVGLIAGLLVSAPPLMADAKWASALRSQQVIKLEDSLKGGYFSPQNSFRLAQAVETLERSNLKDLAVKYAREGVNFNPQSFNAWQMLYYASNSTQREKNLAKSKMIQLDPLNNKWKELP